MKRIFSILALASLASPAFAAIYVAGDFNGWNAAGNMMTEIAPGIHQVSLTSVGAGRHEYKVTDGTWSWNYPGPNSWFYADAEGNITLTFDSNTYADGWLSASQRLGQSVDPGSWVAVGDWQGWNNANPATAMVSQGGGIYLYQQVITPPGTHEWKAVVSGTWDSISWDNRSVSTANYAFTTTETDNVVRFWVNATNGTARVEVVPEPSALALAGSALVMGLARRRRTKE